MAVELPTVLQAVLESYALPLDGYHGLAHWARVLENGLLLAERVGANVEVVRLFAVLHDSRRSNESSDPEHGPRAAQFAAELRGQVFELPEDDFQLLQIACFGHSHEHTHADVTIQTCWDSDRLDLGRVGISPTPDRLCTAAAQDPEIIAWAHRRAVLGHMPRLIVEDWGIDPEWTR